MAEQDRFEKAIPAGWRGSYRRARNVASSMAEVSDCLLRDLAKHLRRHDGIPGFLPMVEALHDTALRLNFGKEGNLHVELVECFSKLDQIVVSVGGHRNAKVAAEAAKELLVALDIRSSSLSAADVRRELAVQICKSLVRHFFFGTARQNLVAEGKCATADQALSWQARLEQQMHLYIGQLAGQLERDPDARRIRGPRRTVPRRTTTELLNEDLKQTATRATTVVHT